MNKSPGVLQATGAAPYGGGPIPASLTLRGSGKRKLQNISSDLQVDPLDLQQTRPLVCLGLLHGHSLAAAELFAAAAYSFRLDCLPCARSEGSKCVPCQFSGCCAVHMLRCTETRTHWVSLLPCRGSGRVPSCSQGCAAALQGRRCRCDGWFDQHIEAKPMSLAGHSGREMCESGLQCLPMRFKSCSEQVPLVLPCQSASEAGTGHWADAVHGQG